jgi:hypothetical protein
VFSEAMNIGFSRLLEVFHAPGFIRPGKYGDVNTGQYIQVKTNRYYTEITVNGLELFFYRRNGRYDGWGRMAANLPHCTVADIRESAPSHDSGVPARSE